MDELAEFEIGMRPYKNTNPEVCLRRDIGVLRCKDRKTLLILARIQMIF